MSFSKDETKLVLTYTSHSDKTISSSALAVAGFQYIADDQRLVCQQCGLQVANDFTEYFDPVALHTVYSHGKCPWLMKTSRNAEESRHRNLGE